MLTVGSLFSGVGGFELGLERAGMRCIWQAETDAFASAVLRKHWPHVPNLGDVTKIARRVYDCEPENEDGEIICPRCCVEFGECDCVGTDQLVDEYGTPDVICGGFPCQDVSNIGGRLGIAGARSGLWSEFARIVGELGPRYVIVENVSALLVRGLGRILGDLAALGFDAQWHCIPAFAVGAPHRRDRVWIIGYDRRRTQESADAFGERLERQLTRGTAQRTTDGPGYVDYSGWWITEPGVRRVADGIPSRMDRLRCLGNAIVPQIAELIGVAIVKAEQALCVE